MEKQSNKIEIYDYATPHYLSRTVELAECLKKNPSDKTRTMLEFLVTFKGYQMLVALYQGTDSHIGERCAYYLTDNGEIDMKFTMKRGEGSFMTSVLEGDVLGAIRRGSQEYRAILCDAIKERRLEI